MAQSESLLAPHPTDRLLGRSPLISDLRAQIRHLAAFDTVGSPHAPTVLLQGETGTGKGLVARVIHDSGPRAQGSFIDINCAAIPETLLEAELFGFEAGTFTDAKRAKPGLLEVASQGTLFLDEIEALPLPLQGKFLKALEEKWVRRLGAVQGQAVDVKVIAATTANLWERVAEGRFRADLYHRLAVVVLMLPPLRERVDDIILLADQFLQRYAKAHGVSIKQLSEAAEAWLRDCRWLGNVRELSHLMERVTLLSREPILSLSTLEQFCLPQPPVLTQVEPESGTDDYGLINERMRVLAALRQTRGNVVQAARLLGLSRGALRHRMHRYGLKSPRGFAPASATSGKQPVTPMSTKGEAALALENLAAPAPVWERKLVAVLAIELTFPVAPEDEAVAYEPWTAASRWEQAIIAKVQGFGGVVFQRSPSLLLVGFGIPQTLEQLPQRAVQAALALRQLGADAGQEPRPALRLAVHWGSLLVDVHTIDPTMQVRAVGETLAWPVRLLGQVAPGDILISPEIGHLVEGWCELQAREVPLYGEPSSQNRAYAVVGNKPQWSSLEIHGLRPLSRFVGRERELATLSALLLDVARGRGQVVGVIGDPGVGKSRLVYEFAHAHVTQGWHVLESAAVSYGKATPYFPVIALLRHYCAIDDRDDTRTVRAKVTGQVLTLDAALQDTIPALLALLEVLPEDSPFRTLDPPQRHQRTLEAFKRVLLRESQVQPLILVFEDLHWIDAETQALLNSLVESVPTARLLLLVTYRPEYQHTWGSKTYYSQLRLDPLVPASAEILLQALLGNHPSLAPLMPFLIARTEGNPFFLEESVSSLVETQVLMGERGAYRLAQMLPNIQVPATVQAVLAARIDRLPPEEKHLLQAAAVIGKEVPAALLQTIVEIPWTAVQSSLTHLQAAEFLYETALFPERVYTFKHALTQEVAYNAVLLERRRGLHERAAQAIEELLAERLPEHYNTLAHHYSRSGNIPKAVDYLQRAGYQAIERSAYVEAVDALTNALDLLTTLPESHERSQQELVVQMTLGMALGVTKGQAAPEVERLYTHLQVLCEQVGEPQQLFRVMWGRWMVYNSRGNYQMARALGEQLLSLAQRLQDPDLLLEAHHALSTSLFTAGELTAARAHQEQGLLLYDPKRHRAHAALYSGHDPGVCFYYRSGVCLWLLGYPDQAVVSSQAARALAQQLVHPLSLAIALYWAAMLHHMRREAPLTQACAEALTTVATDQGFPIQLAQASLLRGWALAESGHGEEGRAPIQQGLIAYQATGAARDRPYYLGLLAEACAHSGQIAEGLKALAEALARLGKSEVQWWEAELHRLRGELLLQHTVAQSVKAEACFQQALTVARHQQAKSLELRATISLARLWQKQGKRVEAYELLAPIYRWFTEGFDTADLQKAQTVLNELA